MKCILQLISIRDGKRSPVVSTTPPEFAKALDDDPTINLDDHGVLVIMQEVEDAKSGDPVMDFSLAPFVSCKRFVELFNGVQSHG